MAASTTTTEGSTIKTTRTLNAPIDLVWEAFSKPEHVMQWFGPNGFTNTIQKMDFHAGGEWIFVMHGPDGKDYDNHIVYERIVPKTLITWEHGPYPKFLTTIELKDLGGRTELSFCIELGSVELRDKLAREVGAIEGQTQTVERLAAYLERQFLSA